MSKDDNVTEEIFPKGSGKTYAIVETMRGKTPMVGKGPDDTVFSFPIVLLLEAILLLGVTFVIFLFSLLKQAPLGEIANPMITTDPAKAPWYFIGLQELLEHMHPLLAGIILPTLLVLFLMAIPYIDYSRIGTGVWLASGREKRIATFTAIYTLIAMPAYIVLDNTYTMREILRDKVPQWIAQGLVPGGMLLVLALVPVLILVFQKPSRREIILVLFTIIIVAAFVFTISGFLFRGPGFKLYPPWDMPDGYNPWDDF